MIIVSYLMLCISNPFVSIFLFIKLARRLNISSMVFPVYFGRTGMVFSASVVSYLLFVCGENIQLSPQKALRKMAFNVLLSTRKMRGVSFLLKADRLRRNYFYQRLLDSLQKIDMSTMSFLPPPTFHRQKQSGLQHYVRIFSFNQPFFFFF